MCCLLYRYRPVPMEEQAKKVLVMSFLGNSLSRSRNKSSQTTREKWSRWCLCIPGDNLGADGVDGETSKADNPLQGRVEEEEIFPVGALEPQSGAKGHMFLASSGHCAAFFAFLSKIHRRSRKIA